MDNEEHKDLESEYLRSESEKFTKQMNELRIGMLIEKFQPKLNEEKLRRYLNEDYTQDIFDLADQCPTLASNLVNDLKYELAFTKGGKNVGEEDKEEIHYYDDAIFGKDKDLHKKHLQLYKNDPRLLFKDQLADLRTFVLYYAFTTQEDPMPFLRRRLLFLIAEKCVLHKVELPEELKFVLKEKDHKEVDARKETLENGLKTFVSYVKSVRADILEKEDGMHPKIASNKASVDIDRAQEEEDSIFNVHKDDAKERLELPKLLPKASQIIDLFLQTKPNEKLPLSLED